MAEKKPGKGRARRRVKKNVTYGQAHIKTSFNNTIVTLTDTDGNVIGKVTSGGPSPTLGKNIAMGYVPPAFSELGTDLTVIVRGRASPAEVVAMPFVAQKYYRKPKA